MPKEILIRNVPNDVLKSIGKISRERGLSQQAAILSVLQSSLGKAHHSKVGTRLSGRTTNSPFTFIDLFAGIGGFRIALQELGGQCVYTSEWDKHAQATYLSWHGELPHGDIRQVDPAALPDHDILAAGFPCQPFSIAGVSKKKSMGRAHGFKDKKQGNLFFYLADIIRTKRPPVLLLENVKNLKSHDKGNTWKVIRETLEGIGYNVFAEVIDAASWVPQHRERIFIVGFDKKVFGDKVDFHFPERPKRKPVLVDILDPAPSPKYTLTDNLWNYLQRYAEKHKALGHGFGFGIADPNGITRTLSARYYKDGSEILISQGPSKSPRRLSPKECQRLMGYPENLPIVVSDTQAYRQFGNGVVVPVVRAVARQIFETVDNVALCEEDASCYLKGKKLAPAL